ncbi:LysR substrate-binding domain-containing protein [Biformimicrobium ophioploci]|uniref:LysR substrate-binding domain-containing protein n=1 Tax=Biformimicrobium ophioploci TaxID=3036711 RepID=A0ABQ6LUV8_9GAMM|nr:LysR substrate-binding domain-containing protein [Microbulbifer sp. NKW57]GMG85846.1 LysR substrate-binding domain-containing protein [Microbulbifer sp. NKW57]
MITLEALQVLDAIDRRGSFAAAAQELHKVPSALSYTVRQLEENLGVALFDRSGQRARMTPTGRMLLEQGRELLQAADLLAYRAKQAASGWEPALRVVVEALLPMGPLWPLLAEFSEAHPQVELELREEVLNGSWESLMDQRADLIIGVAREGPPGLKVQRSVLGRITLPLVCAPHHPLAGLAAEQLDEHAFAEHAQIVLRDSARRLAPVSVGLYRVRRRILVDHYAAKQQAIEQGLGFGTLPQRRIRAQLESGALVVLPVQRPKPVTLHCAWERERAGKGLRWLVQEIEKRQLFAAYLD